jgi:hypothetical protein
VPRAKVQLSLSVSVHEYSRRLLFLTHRESPQTLSMFSQS